MVFGVFISERFPWETMPMKGTTYKATFEGPLPVMPFHNTAVTVDFMSLAGAQKLVEFFIYVSSSIRYREGIQTLPCVTFCIIRMTQTQLSSCYFQSHTFTNMVLCLGAELTKVSNITERVIQAWRSSLEDL
jgi:hypothetical protein